MPQLLLAQRDSLFFCILEIGSLFITSKVLSLDLCSNEKFKSIALWKKKDGSVYGTIIDNSNNVLLATPNQQSNSNVHITLDPEWRGWVTPSYISSPDQDNPDVVGIYLLIDSNPPADLGLKLTGNPSTGIFYKGDMKYTSNRGSYYCNSPQPENEQLVYCSRNEVDFQSCLKSF